LPFFLVVFVTEEDKQFVLGILVASGANSMEEKIAARKII
jgi:hypothetical protein